MRILLHCRRKIRWLDVHHMRVQQLQFPTGTYNAQPAHLSNDQMLHLERTDTSKPSLLNYDRGIAFTCLDAVARIDAAFLDHLASRATNRVSCSAPAPPPSKLPLRHSSNMIESMMPHRSPVPVPTTP